MAEKLKFIIFDNNAEDIQRVGSGVFIFTLATAIDTVHFDLSGNFKIQTRMALDDHEQRLTHAGCDSPSLYRASIEIPKYHSLQNDPTARMTYVRRAFDIDQAVQSCPKAQCTVVKDVNELRKLYDDLMLERKRALVTVERQIISSNANNHQITQPA